MIWNDLLDEGIPLILLIALCLVLYRGLRKNQVFLMEREELLKRYLLFRGDKQVHLKIYEGDEKAYQGLLKSLSNSLKIFKKNYDQYLLSFAQNTAKTKLSMQIITLGLLINSIRLFIGKYFFFGLKIQLISTIVRELSSYVLVILGFYLLKTQTNRFLNLKGEAVNLDREILFYPSNQSREEEVEHVFNEFNPLEMVGGENGKEDKDHHR